MAALDQIDFTQLPEGFGLQEYLLVDRFIVNQEEFPAITVLGCLLITLFDFRS